MKEYEHPWFCDYTVNNDDGTSCKIYQFLTFGNLLNLALCGGTLISKEYIVTAAHCFDGAGQGNIHKRIVDLKCGAKNSRVLLNATKVIKHPGWNKLAHDIAVIKIQNITYSTIIRPACVMNQEELLLNNKLIVVGRGHTRK